MNINFGFTDELTNTSYAPLAALFAHYQRHNLLQPLENVQIPMRKRDFELHEKLKQTGLVEPPGRLWNPFRSQSAPQARERTRQGSRDLTPI